MAQAQVTLERGRAPSRLWLRVAAAVSALRTRREERRAVVRLLAERDTGIATGARV